MDVQHQISIPQIYMSLREKSLEIGFDMDSDLNTCALIRSFIAAKPDGRFLELGTGVGLALSWMVDGMTEHASVTSIDNDQALIDIVSPYFEKDDRVTLICQDGSEWIRDSSEKEFDLIFADAWPGKYSDLDETLDMLSVGGVYFIDDLSPAANWPEGHAEKVDGLISYLSSRSDFTMAKLDFATGLIIATKRSN